jgi:4'-phosphopantetheinyl transferase
MLWQLSETIPQIASGQNILVVYGTFRPSDLGLAGSILSKDELDFANRIRAIQQKRSWISCHVTLRLILAEFLRLRPVEINFNKNRFGRLSLANSNLFFNLSHTDSSFLLGFSMDGKIGVDLEKLSGDEDLTSLMEYAFSTEETGFCMKENSAVRFLEIWTLKEAFLKAAGIGLVDNLSSVNVSGNMDNILFMKKLNYKTLICPNGETASIVYRKEQTISYVWLC